MNCVRAEGRCRSVRLELKSAMAVGSSLGVWRWLCFAMVLMTAVQASSAGRHGAGDSLTCMTEWLMRVGIPEMSARRYENKTEFYGTQHMSIYSLRYVRHADLLNRLGITRPAHQELVLRCAADSNSCPDSPCRNGGSCLYAKAEQRFQCDCSKGWVGNRCDTKGRSKMTKNEMRLKIRTLEDRVKFLEGLVSNSSSQAAEKERQYTSKIASQQQALDALQMKIDNKESKNEKRKMKLRSARERATNSTRDLRTCRELYQKERAQKSELVRKLNKCRIPRPQPVTRPCGIRRDGRDSLRSRGILGQGSEMVSPDDGSRLVVRPNGTIQVYNTRTRGIIWSSPDNVHSCASHNGPYRLVVMPNGNIQSMDNSNCVLWSSGTTGADVERNVCVRLGNYGKLSLYNECGQMLWTNGRDPNRT